MKIRDEALERQWRALQDAKRQRFQAALEIAMTCAWDDLTEDQQTKYLAFALTAVKDDERERIN